MEAYILGQQEWRMAAHNGSTDVSTTPLPGILDTHHPVSHVCMILIVLHLAGKVEAQLKTHPLVENICVYGDSFQNHTVAIMVPIQQAGATPQSKELVRGPPELVQLFRL